MSFSSDMWQRKYGNKYGDTRAEHAGLTYHSKFEAGYAAELDLRKKAKDIKDWKRQVRIEFNLKKKGKDWVLTAMDRTHLKNAGITFIHITTYILDFIVYHNDGSEEMVEVKGKMLLNDPQWKTKWRLLEAVYGETNKLTVVS